MNALNVKQHLLLESCTQQVLATNICWRKIILYTYICVCLHLQQNMAIHLYKLFIHQKQGNIIFLNYMQLYNTPRHIRLHKVMDSLQMGTCCTHRARNVYF